MSGEAANDERAKTASSPQAASAPGSIPRPKLRRRPFGYSSRDVDEALDARDFELAELRQDVAALWLAFAQHDRLLRAAFGDAGAPRSPQPSPPAADPMPPASEPGPAPTPPPPDAHATTGADPATPGAHSVGRQLADLDDALAAIEMATQTLEQTYGEEIGSGRKGARGVESTTDEPAETET